MLKPQRLVCQSCGSTDITIDPPFYRCNHCGSQHRLPEEPLPRKEMNAWYRKHWRLLTVLTALVAVLTGMVLYNTLLLRSTIHPASAKIQPAESPAKLPQKSFRNKVFSTDTLKSIYDLIPTHRSSYLIAGVTPHNHILVAEISATGKTLHSRKLAKGFYVSLAERKEGGAIVSMYQSDQRGETDYLDARYRIIQKVPKGFAQITGYEGGFIGVRDARIARYDRKGKLLWQRLVDPGRDIARAGKHLDADGNMVPFAKQFTSLELRKVTRLKDGDFVAIGKEREGRFALVLFTLKGEILRYRKIDLGCIYPDALHPAKDGGFIVLARRGIQWLRFDKTGRLIEKKNLHRNLVRDLYGYAIAEDSKGYIATYMEKGAMIIARVNDDGTVLSRHRYALPGVRLHPEKIVPAFDGGFLLAVHTEIHEPWLVKVDSDGRLDADLNDPMRSRAMAKKHGATSLSVSPKQSGDILPSQTHIEPKAPQIVTKQIVPTTAFPGSRIYDMIISPDGKYLYVATNATGFKIFRLMPDGSVRLLSNLLRTTSRLIVKPHSISIAGGVIPPHGTPEYYDAAYKVLINRAQTRAYVGDVQHGFYVVDISDKVHPKLLIALKGVKSVAFALSADEKSLYFYDGNIHIWPIESLAEHKESKLNSYTGPGDMVSLYQGALLAIAPSGKREVLIYDTRLRLVTEQYRPPDNVRVHALYADEENNLFLAASKSGIEQVKVSRSGWLSPITSFSIDDYIHDLIAFPKIHTLCYAGDKGVACYDTRDKNADTTPKILYRDAGLHRVTALARGPGSDTLYIAFVSPSIGRVKVKQ